MGNIATPNTPYCLGFQQASLSVGNKTFSTQNPPISYSIDGSTVTVFDALGVIGITPYSSDDFVEISSSPASPNTNYCSSAKAVLSWSGGTIETLNTPISYQLRSNIIEWGNSGIVQGIYNAPTAVNSASIQSNANKLLINGQIETFNKPVASWQNIPQNQIRIDWGSGDIETISGSSVTFSGLVTDIPHQIPSCLETLISDSGNYTVSGRWGACSSFPPFTESKTGTFLRIEIYHEFCISQGAYGCSTDVGTKLIFGLRQDGTWESLHNTNPGWAINNVQIVKNFDIPDNPRLQKYRVTSNTGAFSERLRTTPPVSIDIIGCILRVTFSDNTTQDLIYPTCPTVQSIPGCTVAIVLANSTAENISVNPCPDFVNVINNEVTVFDDTGQVFKADYLIPPLNFQVTCYDFNVTEASYVCQGDCPSGTEFRCVCPTTNTIMCYGFDPENPNVFKPLFTTQITS